MRKKISAFLVLFFGFCFATTLQAQDSPHPELFVQEVSRAAAVAFQKRDGLVVWLDRNTGERQLFGNPALLAEKFRPGSLMKLLTAEVAMQRAASFQYRCSGFDRSTGKTRHCWTSRGHGELDLAHALGVSCNLYFSALAVRLGFQALRHTLQNYGFAEASSLPPSLSPSHLADLGIGDSPLFHVTPAEMLQFWESYLQRLARPEFQALRQGLRRAVREGTAKRVGAVGLEILGKTGTGDSELAAYRTNGWFLGAYPTENPRCLLLVLMKQAHGFDEAARLAEKIFRLAKSFAIVR
ncbi:MAG TPA: hypothetical protein DF383_10095 [Deltaproteobacteria bacterium]|nr:hypothetical protein [Deltaproteobacteria bacterium]